MKVLAWSSLTSSDEKRVQHEGGRRRDGRIHDTVERASGGGLKTDEKLLTLFSASLVWRKSFLSFGTALLHILFAHNTSLEFIGETTKEYISNIHTFHVMKQLL